MNKKVCFKCSVEKPLVDFYKHPRMADGHLNKCKACTKTDVSSNYRIRHEQYCSYEREREERPDRRANKGEYMRAHRALHPDRYRARSAVSNALRDGRLTKQPCKVCGTTQRVQAHHHDYSKPLDVEWYCFAHHREDHGQQPSVTSYPNDRS